MNLLSKVTTSVALAKKGKFTMKFKKEHQIVKSWVSLVNAGTYTFEEVPNLFNLRAIVAQVLAEKQEAKEIDLDIKED